MSQLILLIVILILALGLPLLNFKRLFNGRKDGFSNYNLEGAMGNVPSAETDVLLQDFYPPIGKNALSEKSEDTKWWHYPIFKLGSYAQITNNIKYPNNPDLGTCMPDSMCGALYHEKQLKSNYAKILPPLNPECGTRVGYFDTSINLLPFRTNTRNILY